MRVHWWYVQIFLEIRLTAQQFCEKKNNFSIFHDFTTKVPSSGQLAPTFAQSFIRRGETTDLSFVEIEVIVCKICNTYCFSATYRKWFLYNLCIFWIVKNILITLYHENPWILFAYFHADQTHNLGGVPKIRFCIFRISAKKIIYRRK